MLEKTNKAFVFTDLHYGIHSNSQPYIDICDETMKWVGYHCRESGVDRVIFMGDFFDSRSTIDVKTLNSATKSLYELADSGIKVSLILGNHDIYLRDSAKIHSLFAYNGHKGLDIVDCPRFDTFGSSTVALLPWLAGMPSNRVECPNGVKYVFCHHNFPTNFFLGGSAKKGSRSDTYMSPTFYEDEFALQQDLVESVVGENGVIFSGHIHQRSEIPLGSGKSKIIIVGSPYETSWGFGNCGCGGYDIDFDSGEITFVPNPCNRVHVEIRTSDGEKALDGIDFPKSIVRISVDTQESFDAISKLQTRIQGMNPFIFENAKYEFSQAEFVGKRDQDANPLSSITHQVSSKLDYVERAIDDADFSAFDYTFGGKAKSVDKERLKSIAKDIFEKI